MIETLLACFPFEILGFHADNGSGYINKTVAELLEKLRVEFTKSRHRHSNDNGLAETKNGAIVRKHLGYSHIPQCFASEVNAFCREFLNPYVNFHRPCFFAESVTDAKGKTRKRYRLQDMMTPYEKLKSLPAAGVFLKPGMTFGKLDQTAAAMSDNEAAERLNETRKKLFQSINRRSRHAAYNPGPCPLGDSFRLKPELELTGLPTRRPSHGERSEGEEPAGGVGPGGWPQATCKDIDTPSSHCGRASCAPEKRTARPQDGRGRAEAGAKAQRVR